MLLYGVNFTLVLRFWDWKYLLMTVYFFMYILYGVSTVLELGRPLPIYAKARRIL